jgi:hypothetical protein
MVFFTFFSFLLLLPVWPMCFLLVVEEGNAHKKSPSSAKEDGHYCGQRKTE